MVVWVMTPSNLIGDCHCFLGSLVPPSSLSQCSVSIILIRAEPLEILEEFFLSKMGKNLDDRTAICASVIARQFTDWVTVLKPSVF